MGYCLFIGFEGGVDVKIYVCVIFGVLELGVLVVLLGVCCFYSGVYIQGFLVFYNLFWLGLQIQILVRFVLFINVVGVGDISQVLVLGQFFYDGLFFFLFVLMFRIVYLCLCVNYSFRLVMGRG